MLTAFISEIEQVQCLPPPSLPSPPPLPPPPPPNSLHYAQTLGVGGECHGGCGALDANLNYFEEVCLNRPPPPSNDDDDGDYVGGLIGGMVACGAAVGLAVGGAVFYDNRKGRQSEGTMPLAASTSAGGAAPGASFGRY
jgi:hypothetical protein